jgi:formamidopyrimidine-DNA glycosylase
MPELPEVETVAAHLRKLVTGSRIAAASLLRERLAPHTNPEEFHRLLAGSTISRIDRRGKYILIGLDNGRTLMVHLRMSGRFMLLAEEDDEPKFTHARFQLAGGKKLLFQDQRHFGFMRVVEKDGVQTALEISKLAPEPFSDDFSAEYLHATAKRSARPIKEFLLDQTRVCGVGNIYASESLFLAGIDPRKRANKLTKPKALRLRDNIRDVLGETLELGAMMPIDPANIGGSIYGDSGAEWRVYGRENRACPSCGEAIRRIVQAGRSTFFCPKCQR